MNEQPQRPANSGKIVPPPRGSTPKGGGMTPPPQPPVPPRERSLRLIDQLLTKTREGKLPWTTGFEDGQFKTVLPKGELAFVVQVKGEARTFLMLDDHQEVILEESVTRDEAHIDNMRSPEHWLDRIFEAIGQLQELARSRALQVNEKLEKAEKLLAAI